MAERTPAKARIVSQATIVFTLIEDEHGRTMDVASFGSPDHESNDAERFADEVSKAAVGMIRIATDADAMATLKAKAEGSTP